MDWLYDGWVWQTWERVFLVAESLVIVTGLIAWRTDRIRNKRRHEMLMKIDQTQDGTRQEGALLIRVICEPDQMRREQLAAYVDRVINAPHEEERQEYLDGIEVGLSADLRAEGSGPASHKTLADGTLAVWRASPGAGWTAAKLIATAPDLEAAREVWGAFYAAPRRTDTRWVYWAFASRLEEAGHGQEVYRLTEEVLDGMASVEELDPDEELEAQIQRWRERAE